MHEYAIAMDIMENVIKEAKENNAESIKSISLEIGALTMINPEQLRFCLEAIAEDSMAEGMDIELKMLPLRLVCEEGHVTEKEPEGSMYDLLLEIKCPKCGKKATSEGGRQCTIKQIVAE